MGLAIGAILQDRYRIVSKLGQGGMGAVYRAWDTRLNIPVALKEMLPQPGLNPGALAQLRRQFLQEAQTLARLDHPHLVRVTDFFSQHDSEYLVMNFVEGENLVDRIERVGGVSESQVLVWANQLLDALAYCHNQGVIHRDVKPQNVIIRSDGQAVLVDFGLVKLWDPHDPHTKTVMRGMGTPQYAPPEQYETDMGHTDARSDVYGVGATLYHALTGQAPPTATQRIANPEQFVPLRDIAPEVSKQTETAVMGAMELALAKRWQSASEMAKKLKVTRRRRSLPATVRLEQGQTVMVPARRPPAAGQRRRVPMWIGGLAVLAVVVVAIVLVTGQDNEGDRATPTSASEKVVPASVPEVSTETATATRLPASTRTPVHTPSPTPVATATPQPTQTPLPTPTATATPQPTQTSSPTPTVTATPQPTQTQLPTPTATATPQPTQTPSPTPTATATSQPTQAPTATPTQVRQAVPPELVAPAQGGQFKNPITFQWSGSLNAGEAYQVTLYHPGSDYTIQSELLTSLEWTTDLPGDRFGEWRWTVSVVRGGSVAATSAEWMFWFDPSPGPSPKKTPSGPPTPPPA